MAKETITEKVENAAETVQKQAEDTAKTVEHKAKVAEDKAETKLNVLADEDADSTDSNVRYAAYLRRIRDVVRAGSRYTAYSAYRYYARRLTAASDVGEAFRPVVPPYVGFAPARTVNAIASLTTVTAAYGVSWAYLIGDVAFTTYKAKEQGPTALEAANFSEPTRLSMVAVKRSVFQGLASMALPAFTIHTAVKQTAKAVKNSANPTIKRWLPSAVGIGIVPFLPFLFDHPVEYATDRVFEKIEEAMANRKPGSKADPPAAAPVREL